MTDLIESPTAEDVRQIMRRSNRWVALGFVLLFIVGGATVYFAAGGRAASKDSLNATAVQLANNSRNACITERRNAQLAAIGEEIDAGQKALKFGLLLGDEEQLRVQTARFDAASKNLEAATESLDPDVLNSAPPLGCGPPIETVDDIQKEN